MRGEIAGGRGSSAAGQAPQMWNHDLKWNPCGNRRVEAKDRAWHINRTMGHDNKQRPRAVIIRASVGDRWHDIRGPVKKRKPTHPKDDLLHDYATRDRDGKAL